MTKCTSCGEREAVAVIWNPNDCSKDDWDVCALCKEYIEAAQELSARLFINDMAAKHGMEHITRDSLLKEFKEKTKHIPDTFMAVIEKEGEGE